MPISFDQQLLLFFADEHVPVSVFQLFVFKTILLLALLLKHVSELKRGYPKHVALDSFFYQQYIAKAWHGVVAQKIYSNLFYFRPLLLVATLLDVAPLLCISILLVTYICELFCLSRFHVVVASLLLLALVIDPAFKQTFSMTAWTSFIELGNQIVSSPAVIFIKTLMLIIYPISAIRKYRRKFHSGVVLAESAKISLGSRKLAAPEHFFEFSKKLLALVLPRHAIQLSKLVILLQLIIPLLLVCGGQATIIAVLLGILLHSGMTLLFPITLAPFTFMIIGMYVLWI